MFHDREGNLLGQSVGTVEPGQGTSFDTRGVIDPNFRTDLIASVRTVVDPNYKNPLVCTLEVIDIATGRTVLVHANPRVIVPDGPDVVP